ncbi:hypothetical protein ACFOLG_07425 [Vogesella facilis]|uniref:Uncharacterized protein n=1 Tax=Vogesella facilis TaxID=1655232 RepID=A0ABV7RCD9_9NEIS
MQHGHSPPTPLTDIDVIYLALYIDLAACRQQEAGHEHRLLQRLPLPMAGTQSGAHGSAARPSTIPELCRGHQLLAGNRHLLRRPCR